LIRPPAPDELDDVSVLVQLLDRFKDDLYLIVAATVAALVRAMGVTVQSGQTGLLFSFGRARRTLAPGFHVLIPFLQRARRVPTRSRTLDLPAQRVATMQGLVYHADANLVYRIFDVRKALIEIDDLERGMLQMLGLGVQEVLRRASHDEIRETERLGRELARNLALRLAPWGVEVERAGFPSITPSPRSVRITQIEKVTGERRQMLLSMQRAGLGGRKALCLIGARIRHVPKTRGLRRLERQRRRAKRLRHALMQHGWMSVQIKQAGVRLRTRVSAGGKLRVQKPEKGADKKRLRRAKSTRSKRASRAAARGRR